MASPTLLLVDDDDLARSGMKGVLEAYGFKVTEASGPKEALRLIASEEFDVLISDLHMPGAGDGLTLVSAMRHANPDAVAILLSAMPDMARAAEAILNQVDEVLTKPMPASDVVEIIRERLARIRPAALLPEHHFEGYAELIERETPAIVQAWLTQTAAKTGSPDTSDRGRSAYLGEMLRDLALRLRWSGSLGSNPMFSIAARQHGTARRRQGEGPETLAEEMRILQIVLFNTIQSNPEEKDQGSLAAALMTISDELHAQLAQCLTGYAKEYPIAMPPTY